MGGRGGGWEEATLMATAAMSSLSISVPHSILSLVILTLSSTPPSS